MWVAVGNPNTGTTHSIQYSTDGIKWENSDYDKFLTGKGAFGVAYNPVDKMWVAVGSPSHRIFFYCILEEWY